MNRLLSLVAVIVLATPWAMAAQADANDAAADKVEVIEFFWYGCPHCHNFQPHFQAWARDLPDDVEVSHVPVMLSPDWEVHARAFYTAVLLGGIEDFHNAFYNAIHEQGRRLNDAESIAAFAGSVGMDEERFLATMDSFAVDTRIRAARNLQREFRVSGTPSVGIAGDTISPRDAGSLAGMLEMMDERVARARD